MPRSNILESADHHAAMHRGLHWQVDEHFNIATVCSGRWSASQPAAVAIVEHRPGRPPGLIRTPTCSAAPTP